MMRCLSGGRRRCVLPCLLVLLVPLLVWGNPKEVAPHATFVPAAFAPADALMGARLSIETRPRHFSIVGYVPGTQHGVSGAWRYGLSVKPSDQHVSADSVVQIYLESANEVLKELSRHYLGDVSGQALVTAMTEFPGLEGLGRGAARLDERAMALDAMMRLMAASAWPPESPWRHVEEYMPPLEDGRRPEIVELQSPSGSKDGGKSKGRSRPKTKKKLTKPESEGNGKPKLPEVMSIKYFRRGIAEDFALVLKRIVEDGHEQLIIDLRGDPKVLSGGCANEAIDIARLFVRKSVDLVRRQSKDGAGDERCPSKPVTAELTSSIKRLFVLTNRWTASAPELLAGILKHQCGAMVIGADWSTWGKGIMQTFHKLPNNGVLKTTHYELAVPGRRGQWHKIHGFGVESDVVADCPLTEAVRIARGEKQPIVAAVRHTRVPDATTRAPEPASSSPIGPFGQVSSPRVPMGVGEHPISMGPPITANTSSVGGGSPAFPRMRVWGKRTRRRKH